MPMRPVSRREFLGMAAAGAALTVVGCGGDDDEGAPPAGAAATSAAPAASPVAASPTVTPGADAGAAEFRWYGQSMFVVRTPGGVDLLTDPFNDIGYVVPDPASIGASVVTITHEHPDHNNDALAGGATVIRGLTSDGWNDVDEAVGDLRIRTVRTYHDDQQGAQRGRNAAFVFETAGLRIVHLGDLGHMLQDEHVDALGGPVDILMVPVGGTFTIGDAVAAEVLNRLGPKLVFPMHYRTDRAGQALAPIEPFLAAVSRSERVGSSSTRLSRDALPAETTVQVLDYFE